MVDVQFVRENPERMRAIINSGRGNPEKANIDLWLKLDKERTLLVQQRDALNTKKNELANLGKSGATSDDIRKKGQELKQESQKIEESLTRIEKEWQEILAWMPNIPHQDMPEGKGEDDNLIIRAWDPANGYVENFNEVRVKDSTNPFPARSMHWDKEDLKAKHHLEIGEALELIDNNQGAKVSGSRFTYIVGDLALMQYAIQQLLFSKLLSMGFKQIIPPLLVREVALFGTSHFPEQVDQVYKIDNTYLEDSSKPLYLVGSSEPSNFSYFIDKTLSTEALPIKLFAYTSCFRSEAGSWGRDTKGIKRLHQFDKIEMNVVCRPEESDKIFDELLSVNEWLLQELQLPYHLVLKCTGDAGYMASSKQIDPEVWLPGQKEFMEVMTDTNTTDYQARRLNIKFKDETGAKKYVHTVNDTGVAMGRMLIAIIDNYQQADGTIKVPEALRKFMGKDYIGK